MKLSYLDFYSGAFKSLSTHKKLEEIIIIGFI
ncbi:hypothetical protein Asal01_02745 [Fodinibius salicampi]